ncbi:hypothetical protein Tco_1499966 [Tanacetum coccineum]
MFLVYGGDTKRVLRISCYTNAGYLTDADDMKSQTGYVFILNGGAVDWKSIKQKLINMYCDNTGTIAIAKDHGVTKEIVDTDDNLADPFTKALAFPKHSELTEKIGMIPASSLM